MLARTPALSPGVHRAFANGLDLAYLVAAVLGLLAAVLVFTLARPRPRAQSAGAQSGSAPTAAGSASSAAAAR